MNNMQSDMTNELDAALSKAQGQMGHAIKDKQNPFFKSNYADLSAYLEVIREPFAANGLTLTQPYDEIGDNLYIYTRIGHASGQWILSKMKVRITKFDAQSIGSCLTYYRRYMLAGLCGIGSADDDGHLAKEAYKEEPKPAEPPRKISDQQCFELDELIERLPDERQKNFMNYISQTYGKLCELTADQYESVKKNLIRALNEKKVEQ